MAMNSLAATSLWDLFCFGLGFLGDFFLVDFFFFGYFLLCFIKHVYRLCQQCSSSVAVAKTVFVVYHKMPDLLSM